MGTLSRVDLRKRLQERDISPVYTLFGSEGHLRDLAVKTISEYAFAAGELREFNEIEFSLASADLGEVLASAQQLPMMASRRVLRVTDVRISASGMRDTLKDEHEDALNAYLASPSPTSVLIFIAEEIDKRKRIAKLLIDRTTAVEFTSLDDRETAEWLLKQASEMNVTLTEPVARQLVATAGNDLRRLTNELHKLAAAAIPGDTITPELVDDLVVTACEISNFAVTDNLAAGNGDAALAALRRALAGGAEPLAILGLISHHYRRLLMVKDLMQHGAPSGEIERRAKLFGPSRNTFFQAARRIDANALKNAIRRIADTDLAIKTSVGGSGPAGARLQIEILVCELAAN
jgi:DNA polymerase-3 subunit delta